MPLLIKIFFHRSFPFFCVCFFMKFSRNHWKVVCFSNDWQAKITSRDHHGSKQHQPPAPVAVWLSWVVCVGASRTPVNNLGSCSWRLCARVSLANFLIRTVNYYFPPGLMNGLVSSDFLLIFLMKILQALLIISMWKVFSLVPKTNNTFLENVREKYFQIFSIYHIVQHMFCTIY